MFSACPKRFLAAVCKAASIAPITLLLSMPFWRPISSMTEISSRFMIPSPLWSRRCSPCHHPSGLGNGSLLEGNGTHRRRFAHRKSHGVVRHFSQCSHQTPLPGKGLPELEAHPLPDCPLIVLNPFKGPIQTRRGNFKRVGMRKRVSDVQCRAECLVSALAIFQCDATRFVYEHTDHRTRPLPYAHDINQFQA